MVDISYTVGQYLQTLGIGTLGTDIFIGQEPAENNGIYIIRGGGQPNNYVPIEETVVDIYCKDIKSEVCMQKLERIKRSIHRQYSLNIGDSFVYTFLVIGDIIDVQRDPEYAKIYKITIQAVHRDKTLIS